MDFVDLHVWKKNLFIFPEEKNTFKFQLFMIKIILVTYINLGWNICIKNRYNTCSFLSILRLISFHLLHHWMSFIQDLNLIMPDTGITEVPPNDVNRKNTAVFLPS